MIAGLIIGSSILLVGIFVGYAMGLGASKK